MFENQDLRHFRYRKPKIQFMQIPEIDRNIQLYIICTRENIDCIEIKFSRIIIIINDIIIQSIPNK